MALDPRALWENASAEGRRAAAARSAGNCAGGPTRLAAAVGFGAFGIVAFAGLARQSRSPSRTNISDGRGGAPAAADTLLAMWDDLGACEAAGPTAGTGDRAALELKKVVELKELLKEKGLQVSGNKAQLVARLLEHEAAPEDPAASPAPASAEAAAPAAAVDSAASPVPAPAAAPAPAEAPAATAAQAAPAAPAAAPAAAEAAPAAPAAEAGSDGALAAEDALLAMWDDLGACEAAGPAAVDAGAPGVSAAAGPPAGSGGGAPAAEDTLLAMWDDLGACEAAGPAAGAPGVSAAAGPPARSGGGAPAAEDRLLAMWDDLGACEAAGPAAVDAGAPGVSAAACPPAGSGGGAPAAADTLLATWDDLGACEAAGPAAPGLAAASGGAVASAAWPQGGPHQRVGFGKHSDLTYQQALDEDPDYCRWVLRSEATTDQCMLFKSWLQAGGAQEDQAEHVVNGGAHEQLVGTGKYKDRTYEDVLAEDPDYCGWVASLEDPGDKFAKFQSYIRENAVDIQSGVQVEGGDAKQAVGIGKYKDRTYEDVWNEDLDYCHWVLSLEEVGPKFAKFRAYLNERIQNA